MNADVEDEPTMNPTKGNKPTTDRPWKRIGYVQRLSRDGIKRKLHTQSHRNKCIPSKCKCRESK